MEPPQACVSIGRAAGDRSGFADTPVFRILQPGPGWNLRLPPLSQEERSDVGGGQGSRAAPFPEKKEGNSLFLEKAASSWWGTSGGELRVYAGLRGRGEQGFVCG